MTDYSVIVENAKKLAGDAEALSQNLAGVSLEVTQTTVGIDPFVYGFSVFVLACIIGYYVVWKVTPALHTPLMALTNAISSIIILGAIVAVGPEGFGISQVLGFIAVVFASINIFGGFLVTQRMLSMFKKKAK